MAPTRTTTRIDGSGLAETAPGTSSLRRATPIAVGARWARVDGGPEGVNTDRREVGGIANWYFADHKNKVTLDVHRLMAEGDGGDGSRWRARVQWDISF